ncbi:MAG TPA: hypothetical protein VGP76_03580 [Planctomycetaceae bacterium]|nr:hypothetical protein [Planctomycetaceae bacterium]
MNALCKKSSIRDRMRAFHNGEEGMETLQVVVIVAIAALVIILLNQLIGKTSDGATTSIAGWVKNSLTNLFGNQNGQNYYQ